MLSFKVLSACLASLLLMSKSEISSGYLTVTRSCSLKRDSMVMRKGRPSLKKTVGGTSSSKTNFLSGNQEEAPSGRTNWVPVSGAKTRNDLPKEKNEVKLVETGAQQLIDPRTNPTGAVGLVNYGGDRTYCVSASCSSCKIPLTKARVLEPNEETNNKHPRLECDFCGATYNIRTGEVLTDGNSKKGLMGGIVKGLFASKEKEPLPTYDLGEIGGKVVINLP